MTLRPLTILTGASRGMGLAMAQQLLREGHELLCISRKTHDGLACEQWTQDLARPDTAAARLETWLAGRDASQLAAVTLINNAGMIPRIAPLGEIPAADLADAMRVDLEAPLLLTAAFLRATAGWRVPRRILNISSGLGRRCPAFDSMGKHTRSIAPNIV